MPVAMAAGSGRAPRWAPFGTTWRPMSARRTCRTCRASTPVTGKTASAPRHRAASQSRAMRLSLRSPNSLRSAASGEFTSSIIGRPTRRLSLSPASRNRL